MGSEMYDQDSIPENCPICDEDVTIERRTDVDVLHDSRQVEHIRSHMEENHRVRWFIAEKAIWLKTKLQKIRP